MHRRAFFRGAQYAAAEYRICRELRRLAADKGLDGLHVWRMCKYLAAPIAYFECDHVEDAAYLTDMEIHGWPNVGVKSIEFLRELVPYKGDDVNVPVR